MRMKSLQSAVVVFVLVQSTLSAPFSTKMLPEGAPSEPKDMMSVGRLDQLIRTFGMSPCVSSCLIELNIDFVFSGDDENKDHPADFKKICDSYASASDCFKSCPDVDKRVFDMATSGVQYMCVEKRAEFDRAMPCIKQQKEALKKECDRKCTANNDVRKLIKSDSIDADTIRHHVRNSSQVFEQLSGLCVVLRCSVTCGRNLLNSRCDPDQHVGDLLTEVMLRPLEQNALVLEKSPPEVQEFVARALPDSCAFVVNAEQLDALRHGEEEVSKRERRSSSSTTFVSSILVAACALLVLTFV